MIMVNLLPEARVVEYGMERAKLVEQAVWFALRGMGLKEQAIKRHYNPKGARFIGWIVFNNFAVRCVSTH